MNIDRFKQLEHLFDVAVALPLDQRRAYMEQACGKDAELLALAERLLQRIGDDTASLRAEVEALAAEWPAATATLEPAPHSPDPLPTLGPGDRVGHYVIREQIGEGGFATVHAAEQEHPVRRRVALKIIKLGMDTRQVIARFEAERQALAVMDHAHVAKVFDAGTTATGRPYFVMEYVDGTPITDYCDTRRLSIEERLHLFIQICEAVQHAHQKALIHRDIKPSNVLVALREGEPLVKVIDFGIAKAINHRLTEQTIYTEQGQLIGTPEYMSPEQAEVTADNVDTRSDIYSLGVLLYELLTGALPFDATTLRQGGFAEIQRIVREEEPPKPSTRLSSLGGGSTASARNRRMDPKTLLRELRGDLDWITMRAMEKDRSRRYATAMELAADIRRYLGHEPVVAGPPSTVYRLRKFVRRRLVAVATTLVVAMGLLAATAVSVGFALSEGHQRRLADAAATLAEDEKAIAEAVNEFLNDDLMAAVAPSIEEGKGKDVLMRDVLDVAAQRIEEASIAGGRFDGKPIVEASIRSTLGLTYHKLGEYPAAEPHLDRARELRRRVLGEEDPLTLESMNNLAELFKEQARYEESERLHLATLRIRARTLGDEHPATLESKGNLANLYTVLERFDEAEPLYLETIGIQERLLGSEHLSTLKSMGNLANLYRAQGRYDDAEPLFLKANEIFTRVRGEGHPDTLASMNNLAQLYWKMGRYADAEPLYLKSLELSKRYLGEDHPKTLRPLGNLAILYARRGRYDKAEPLFVETLELRKKVLGETHSSTLQAKMNLALLYAMKRRYDLAEPMYLELLETFPTNALKGNLAILYAEQGRYDEAEPLYLQVLETRTKRLGEEHPETLKAINNLANLYRNQRRFEEAEPLFLKALEIKKRVLGDEHPSTLTAMSTLASYYGSRGRLDKAEELYLTTLEIESRTLGEEHPNTLITMSHLGLVYSAQDRYEDAEPLLVQAMEANIRTRGEEDADTLRSINNLGALYKKQGRYDEAEPLYREALETRRRTLGSEHRDTLSSMNNLASLLAAQGRHDVAEPLFGETLDMRRRLLGEEHPATLKTMTDLASLYQELGRYEEAESALIEAYHIQDAARGAEHRYTRRVVGYLVALYDAWGKPERAAEWREKLQAEEPVLASDQPAPANDEP